MLVTNFTQSETSLSKAEQFLRAVLQIPFVRQRLDAILQVYLYIFYCCLLFVVCCLLFVVCCLLFVVCCLLFVVCCLLFVVVCKFLLFVKD